MPCGGGEFFSAMKDNYSANWGKKMGHLRESDDQEGGKKEETTYISCSFENIRKCSKDQKEQKSPGRSRNETQSPALSKP